MAAMSKYWLIEKLYTPWYHQWKWMRINGNSRQKWEKKNLNHTLGQRIWNNDFHFSFFFLSFFHTHTFWFNLYTYTEYSKVKQVDFVFFLVFFGADSRFAALLDESTRENTFTPNEMENRTGSLMETQIHWKICVKNYIVFTFGKTTLCICHSECAQSEKLRSAHRTEWSRTQFSWVFENGFLTFSQVRGIIKRQFISVPTSEPAHGGKKDIEINGHSWAFMV